MAQIALIGKSNGAGLSADAELLRSIFTPLGHTIIQADPYDTTMPASDVGVFLEEVVPHLFDRVGCAIGLLNLEWFEPAWFDHLHRFRQFWSKTRCAHATLLRLGLPSHYTGFASRDLLDARVPRTLRCLHVKGQSPLKNTEAVLAAWEMASDLPPLTVVSKLPILRARRNVRVLPQLGPVDLTREMNAAEIHLCPSSTEGWGHYITEAMSVMATVVTTDGPPMNEHVDATCGILIPPSATRPRPLRWPVQPEQVFVKARTLMTTPVMDLYDGVLDRLIFDRVPPAEPPSLPTLAIEYLTDPAAIVSAVRTAAALSSHQRRALGWAARQRVLQRNDDFRQRVFAQLGGL